MTRAKRRARAKARSLISGLVLMLAALHAADAAAAEGGLSLIPDWKFTLPVLIVLFFLLVPVLDRVLFQPLLGVLAERERRIDGARQRADQVSAQADALLASYEARVRDAREAAERERRARQDEAKRAHSERVGRERADAEQVIERTRNEIASALESARGQLRRDAEQLAREAATRLLGRAL
jgi:F-type H+-transporting ATPase subunit b